MSIFSIKYHSINRIARLLDIFCNCLQNSPTIIVVVLLSRAKRLSPAPVFFLRLRLLSEIKICGDRRKWWVKDLYNAKKQGTFEGGSLAVGIYTLTEKVSV